MTCECKHVCAPAVPPPCWFLAHDRKEPCGCGGTACEKYAGLMAKLVLCGFNPLEQEDVIFLRNLVVHESGDADRTVTMFAKWKSGFNASWYYKN
ncbi:hypothetical protein IWQ57_002955 [Coemansia nantahalensis]|uniref:Uncharacterized protein n=2 Tax=Coemansia TaxID=4863 RepID=A0ACC1LHP6_9FUNG|nr:hypothetical protein IWQ57_002955 [Coemansia nantahalensis]KAJ2808350.1 hypothetical protein H4R21_000096 [Coemansia helicoidea]